jgi:peptidoglycan/LPS O-acetylase OafA/YrhL
LGVWEHWPFAYWFCWILGALAAESYLGLITLPSWCCQLRSVVFLFLALLAIHVGNAFGARVDSRLGFSLCVPFCGLLDAFTRFLVSLMVMVILNWLVRIEMKGTLPMPLVRPLAFVGLFSYSLYLTHALVLRLADAFVPLPSTPAWTLFRFILYGAASLLFAYGFFTIFERPFLKKTPRPSSSGSPAVSSDSFLPKKPVVPADSQVTN